MADLGKVSVTHGGDWSSTTAYEINTIIRYQNATYISLQDSTGQEPSEESAYWKLIAKDGKTPIIDEKLSDTSENTVQNKIIKNALDNKSNVVIDARTGKKVSFTIEDGIICAREQ